ncbi:winged helix-turn-helix domain-containing protein [Pandoraea apista]|uniref:winged helix-turn-helix domain-containing protein n=1 Tax=Pandoraea apista TaxID=93218 RepID=UPI000F670A71|nr:winged helix-turn-helix domain-containing protein [Pandoraea apista]RRW88822.1 transcriptional regulator [Pandoraea apista]RRW98081.1 transcriptional regulator [Pandoraea apista]
MKYLIENLVVFDCSHPSLSCNGRLTELNENESKLLALILGGLVSKSTVIQQVWGDKGLIVTDNSYHQLVRMVRNRLEEFGVSGRLIKTLPRQGLKFVGTVSMLTNETPPPTGEVTSVLDGRQTDINPLPRTSTRLQHLRQTLWRIEGTFLVGALVWLGIITWQMTTIEENSLGILGVLKRDAQRYAATQAENLALLSAIGVKPRPGEHVYKISHGNEAWLVVCPVAPDAAGGEVCATYLTKEISEP